jgi:hypothetical protein
MRCLHCYDDIREATITDYGRTWLPGAPDAPEVISVWTSDRGSPFCMRAPCLTGVVHEIKHAPLPTV